VKTKVDQALPEPAKRAVGRPRNHSDESERELIFSAAYAAVRDSGGAAVAMNDILTAAGVSTRSFYRHFRSKDDLLCAMYRRDAVRAGERLGHRLATAASPVEAVARWITDIMSFRDQPKAERVTVLGSIVANRAEGSEAVHRESNELLIAPLRAAIVAGAEAGVFVAESPEHSAVMVGAVVFDAAGLNAWRKPATSRSTRRDVSAVTAFCFRALGVSSR